MRDREGSAADAPLGRRKAGKAAAVPDFSGGPLGLFDFLKDIFNPVKPTPPAAPGPAPVPARPAAAAPAAKKGPTASRLPREKPRPLLPGLPPVANPVELAALLKIAPDRLPWLASEKGKHYRTWEIPKRHGKRTIEAPKKELRAAQRRILAAILSKVPARDAAHGFVKGRSPRSNAAPHVGSPFILKLDLRDFFWMVRWSRVSGIFHSLGYSREVSRVLWRLCCHNGRLPQGAPTSPALTNIVCRPLDSRIAAFAASMEGRYTRYADDITLSFAKARKPVVDILKVVKEIVRDEGFRLAPEKTRFLRSSARQSVTGVTVNSKLSPPREEVRNLRALLHEARLKGAAAANRHEVKGFAAVVRGRIEAVRAIDKAKGEKLLAAYRLVAW